MGRKKKYLSRQEVFNRVCEHLLTQKQKAMDGDECKYRTEGGLSCAIGCLIVKGYSERIENYVPPINPECWNKHEGRKLLRKILDDNNINTEDCEFLVDLQNVHDDFATSQWERELRKLSDNYELEFEEDLGVQA